MIQIQLVLLFITIACMHTRLTFLTALFIYGTSLLFKCLSIVKMSFLLLPHSQIMFYVTGLFYDC